MEDRVAAPSASCCPWVPDTREGAWARSEAADTLRGASQEPARMLGRRGKHLSPQRKPQTRAPGRLMSDLRLILFFQRTPGE